MRKLLALSGMLSPVALWAITSTAVPHIVLIAIVFIANALQASLAGSTAAIVGSLNFATGSGTALGIMMNFVVSFFAAGGITDLELIIGL